MATAVIFLDIVCIFKKFNPKTEVAYLHTAVININPEKTILYYDSFSSNNVSCTI